MEYKYRVLSKEKIEELDQRKFKNMYRTICGFGGGTKCVTSEDEGIVFTQLAYSHETYYPDEFFLEYNKCFFYIYMDRKFQWEEPNGTGVNYYVSNVIKKIAYVTSDESIEKIPAVEEVLALLREVLPVWNSNHFGRLNPGDRVITEGVEYRREQI